MTIDRIRLAACERFRTEHATFVEAARVMGEVELPKIRRALHLQDARIEARPKSVSSFVKKTWLKQAKLEDPWREITDKVGARLIVTSLPDYIAASEAIANGLTGLNAVSELDDKVEGLGQQQFGYLGRHIDVQVPGVVTRDGEPVVCEVQVRTVAMHAWAVTDHGLAYKGTADLSSKAARRLNSLSALCELFDEAVVTTINELSSDQSSRPHEYLRHAESVFLDFANTPGVDDLSIPFVQHVLPALTNVSPQDYGALLDEFARSHGDQLTELFGQFGAGSDWETEPAYYLFTQPESVIVFERLDAAPSVIAELLIGTEWELSASKLWAAWGLDFPT